MEHLAAKSVALIAPTANSNPSMIPQAALFLEI